MNNEYLIVHDMTNLFTKEILLYSFSDIKLKQPIRVVIIAYAFLLTFVWTAPILITFGISPFTLVLAILPNFALSTMLSKPIWGGKSFPDWANTQLKFLSSAKLYYDGLASKPLPTFSVEHYITVSRRRDYQRLLQIVKQEKEQRKKRR